MALRDGIEDYECLWLLWDRARRLRERGPRRHLGVLSAYDQALAEIDRRIGSPRHPAHDADALAALRLRIGRLAERLEAVWWDEVDGADDLPAPPSRLSATAGDEHATVAWPKSSAEEAIGYHVYRSRDPKVGFVRLTRVPVDALVFDDTGLDNGLTYHYFVRTCLKGDVQGPRSKTAHVTPRPSPKLEWATMVDLTRSSIGPYRVGAAAHRGLARAVCCPLVRPQVDYCLSDGFYDGFEEMTRDDDKLWSFDIPDLGWRRNADKTLRLKVRIVDRKSKLVTPAIERAELIDPTNAP